MLYHMLDIITVLLIVVIAAHPAGAMPAADPNAGLEGITTVQEALICLRLELRPNITVPAIVTIAYHPIYGEAWLDGPIENVRAVEVWPVEQEPPPTWGD